MTGGGLFSFKRSAKGSIGSAGGSGSSLSSSTAPPTAAGTLVAIDDFGRPIHSTTAYTTGAPVTRQLFGSGYGTGESDAAAVETELLYGYAPLEIERELSLQDVLEIVSECSHQVATRGGLQVPLLFSNISLDISLEGTSNLIRTYVADHAAWLQDIHLAEPLDLAGFIKWGLARLKLQEREGRGFVPWSTYEMWKQSEKAANYPAQHIQEQLLPNLPPQAADLLSALLNLLMSVAAYSSKNGMTARKLAGSFSSYIFGLCDDQGFDETYAEWQKHTDATEHLLLAFIRTQALLPTHLKLFVQGYPAQLNIFHENGKSKVPPGGRVEQVIRVQRTTRFHSRNLIATAGTWEVKSQDWDAFFPLAAVGSSSSLATLTNTVPTYTSHYRHMLNIRSLDEEEDADDGELQRYKSTVDKDWSRFGVRGFSQIDDKQLAFDLNESERKQVKSRPLTMAWSNFTTSGFESRESFLPEDLDFTVAERVASWPTTSQNLQERLRETERLLPKFNFDTTPRELPTIAIDEHFLDAWVEVVVCGGWTRDELKEKSFALIQWKARPGPGERRGSKGRSSSGADDGRTEDRWCLVEEIVPKEYRDSLRDGKGGAKKPSKRISFLRSVRRKPTVVASTPLKASISAPFHSVGSISSTPRSPQPVNRESPSASSTPSPPLGRTQVGSVERKGFISRFSPKIKTSPPATTGNKAADLDRNASVSSSSWVNVMTRPESPTATRGLVQSTSEVSLDPLPAPPPPPKSSTPVPAPTSVSSTSYRDSSYTEASYDGYGGLDENASAGQVLFRGSLPIQQRQPTSYQRYPPDITLSAPSISDSLPSSPKPAADVPEDDVGGPRIPRHAEGQFDDDEGTTYRHWSDSDVRLTAYGFEGGDVLPGEPHLGEVRE